jgi:hypothetical protein
MLLLNDQVFLALKDDSVFLGPQAIRAAENRDVIIDEAFNFQVPIRHYIILPLSISEAARCPVLSRHIRST